MPDFDNFMTALYATVTAIRDGHVHEADLDYTHEDEDGGETRIGVVVRTEVKPYEPVRILQVKDEDEE